MVVVDVVICYECVDFAQVHQQSQLAVGLRLCKYGTGVLGEAECRNGTVSVQLLLSRIRQIVVRVVLCQLLSVRYSQGLLRR